MKNGWRHREADASEVPFLVDVAELGVGVGGAEVGVVVTNLGIEVDDMTVELGVAGDAVDVDSVVGRDS